MENNIILKSLVGAEAEIKAGLLRLQQILAVNFGYNGDLDTNNLLTKKEVLSDLCVTLENKENAKVLVKEIANLEQSLKHQLSLLYNEETANAIESVANAVENLKTIRLGLADKDKSLIEGIREQVLVEFLEANKLDYSVHSDELAGLIYNEFKGATTPIKIEKATEESKQRLELELMFYKQKKQELLESLDGLNDSLKELLNKKINGFAMLTFKRIYKEIFAEVEAYKTIDADSSIYNLSLEGTSLVDVVEALKSFNLDIKINKNTILVKQKSLVC